MGFDLHILPSGRLVVHERSDDSASSSVSDPSIVKVFRTLASSMPKGLFALAAQADVASLPPELGFWREFASLYLTELCHIPESAESTFNPIDPPDHETLSALIRSAPPMVGAEYLVVDMLEGMWRDIDTWVRSEVRERTDGVPGFLAKHAPLWRQVGRVCFHLAENKRDALYPFAFLATYVPGLSQSARAKHLPLSRALEQYAGARNKKALLRLLFPVQQASEKSELVRELL